MALTVKEKRLAKRGIIGPLLVDKIGIPIWGRKVGRRTHL